MEIAIIGSGNVGKALARAAASGGRGVKLTAADPEHPRSVPKAAAVPLVEAVGLRPIDAGGLIMARTLEAMALLNTLLQLRNGWPWQTGWKLLGPTSA